MVGMGLAVFLGLGGVVAYLAGATGLNEIRRLRRVGVPTLALVRYRASGAQEAAYPPRPLLQFTTEDGRVMEVFSPVPSSRSHALVDGGHVPVRYDPADPRLVLVDGRERRCLEYAFRTFGAVTVLGALVLLLSAGR